jgi:6-phosphogluconolactonase
MEYHVYISNSGSEWLSHFIMNGETGALDQQPNIPTASQPGALATDSKGRYLFMSQRRMKRFESFSIDRSSGGLTSIGTTDLEGDAPYLKTDNTDRWLLASYYGAGTVSVHGISDNGALSAKPVQWIETDGHAHSIQTDRSNRLAYVPHTNPANAIFQFHFNEETGQLTPMDPPKLQPDPPQGPRHFVFHPIKDGILYAVNENASTVTAYRFDPNDGRLDPFQLITTLPNGFTDNNSTAEIRMTQDGRYLYASNRGHDSIAIYSVNDDGSLKALGHQPVEPNPRFFDIDPTGEFLYSAGQNSGKLGAFKIDHATGSLEPMATYDVGDAPLWIEFVSKP